MRVGARWALGAALFLMLGWAQAETSESPPTRVSTIVESTPIDYEQIYQLSRDVGPGRMRKVQEGKKGAILKTVSLTYRGERVIKRELLHTERIEPQHEIVLMGKSGFQTSRSGFSPRKRRVMEATAYHPSAGLGKAATYRTATGRRAAFGCAAVDPRQIPLNTWLYVEGYGLALACDTGGAIKGNKIDLCFESMDEVRRFGRRKVVVHVLSPR